MEIQLIHHKIYEIRNIKVILDYDLALLYEVQTKVLNQAVKRNLKRFPEDFMFKLTNEEWQKIVLQQTMRSQFVTASSQKNRNINNTPYAFTEQGIAMLSGILNSDIAIHINIAIMRTFVAIRQFSLTYKELAEKLTQLEDRTDSQFSEIYDALNFLVSEKQKEIDNSNRTRIGFIK
jgi:hypothetical protein